MGNWSPDGFIIPGNDHFSGAVSFARLPLLCLDSHNKNRRVPSVTQFPAAEWNVNTLIGPLAFLICAVKSQCPFNRKHDLHTEQKKNKDDAGDDIRNNILSI